MKAYRMKRAGDDDSDFVVRILKGNEVVKDKDGNVLEKIGGPIGGSNILPLAVEKSDSFIAFVLPDGTVIKTEAEIRALYESLQGPKEEVEEKEVIQEKPAARRGRPKKVQDDDEEADAA